MKFLTAATLIFLAGVWPTLASPLLVEDFDNPGRLAGSIPKTGNSWQAIGGSGILQKSAGSLLISPKVSQEVQSLFSSSISSNAVYAGVTIKVDSAPTAPWILPLSLLGQNVSGGNEIGRIFISTGSSVGHYRVGIENNMDQPVWWPVDLQVSTSYRLILRFTESGSGDFTTLWIDAAQPSDASISEIPEDIAPSIYGIRLNPYPGTTGAMTLDDLVVTTDFDEALAPGAGDTSNSSKIALYKKRIRTQRAKLAKAKQIRNSEIRETTIRRIRQKIRALKQLLDEAGDTTNR